MTEYMNDTEMVSRMVMHILYSQFEEGLSYPHLLS